MRLWTKLGIWACAASLAGVCAAADFGSPESQPHKGNIWANEFRGIWAGSPIGAAFGGAGTINGLLKANGSGTVSLAQPGTDYVTPAGVNAVLGGVVNGAMYVSGANIATATISGTALTVGSISGGTIVVGQTLQGPGVTAGSTIVSIATPGTNYVLSQSSTVGVATAMTTLNLTPTYTANEVVVETALGGSAYKVSPVSQQVNLTINGPGGDGYRQRPCEWVCEPV